MTEMKRRDFLRNCAVLGGISALGQSVLSAGLSISNDAIDVRVGKKRPNFVFIFIDDMGWKDVGFMGSKYYETRHIDRLASEGMVFTDAYANGANCAPTRACLLTGQYSPRHGVITVNSSARGSASNRRLVPVTNDTTLDASHVTFAEVLKEAGYVSASMGKWHMGPTGSLGPIEQGFDVNIAGREWGSPSGGGYSPPLNYPNLVEPADGMWLTDRLNQEAVNFIEDNRNNPFFLYLTHYAVHTPNQARDDLKAYYSTAEKIADRTTLPDHDNPTYAGMIHSVDDGVGMIMDKLRELGLDENTVVFFFSDNGGGSVTDMYPLRGRKGMFFEGGIREPMIVRWQGHVKPGTTCSEPVIGIDFFPTFLELAGVKVPDGKILDGESIVPLMKGGTSLNREAIFWHFPAYLDGGDSESREPIFRTRPVSVMRKGKWKIMQFFEEWLLDGGWSTINTNNAIELFDLEADIGEQNNLATNPAYYSIRDSLLTELIAWQNSIGAPNTITDMPASGY